jgi:hypothetical protein
MARKPLIPGRLPGGVKRRLEVAAAMAWEALVQAHTGQALHFIALLSDRVPFEDAVDRYIEEMGTSATMGKSVRTRVLSALEDAEDEDDHRPSLQLRHDEAGEGARPDEGDEGDDGGDGARGRRRDHRWRRFRPDVVMRGVQQRHRLKEESERWIQLAIARAEEGIIGAHIDNAITFAALLDGHYELDRAVEEYIAQMGVTGSRAQAVFQRTMARLAEVHLPDAAPGLTAPGEEN